MSGRRRRSGAVGVALAGLLAVSACEDPAAPEHGEPDGVELELNGVVIASYDGGAWTGEMTVGVGQETAHIGVHFVDEDGDRITFDDDLYLEVDVDDEGIAEFEQDTPGEFGGHLHGVALGTTEVVFRLMHGAVGSGHADFVTQPVVARVQ